MKTSTDTLSEDLSFPAIADRNDFDCRSGNPLERLIFNHRKLMLIISLLLSLFLGYHAVQIKVNASFERMIPTSHPYIQNYLGNKNKLRGLSNSIRVVVENTKGDIFDKEYLVALRGINDIFFLMPGVDRSWMRSMWTPFVRWTAVTETGFDGGALMPDTMDFSPAAFEQLKNNIARSSTVGSLIADDMRSSQVYVPLLDEYADGTPIDYGKLGRDIETKVRSLETDKIKVHVVGFGKLAGDLIDGLDRILGFFAVSAAIATLFVLLLLPLHS